MINKQGNTHNTGTILSEIEKFVNDSFFPIIF